MTISIDTLNDAPRHEAIAAMEPLVERSPWVAEVTVDARPFTDADAVAAALVETILLAGRERQIALFRVHPELAGREAREMKMTAASTSEQDRLGLLALSSADAERLSALNAAYRARFGHPFIVALHRVADRASLFQLFERRLAASPIEEHAATLAEIASVIHSRASRAFSPPACLTSQPAAANKE